MKILLIPLGWDKPEEHKDLVDAFNRNGHDAYLFKQDIFFNKVKPDIIFYQGGLNEDQCKQIKLITQAKWITWTGDVRYAPLHHLQECKEFTDLYLLPMTGFYLQVHEHLLQKPCKFIWEYFHDYRFRGPKELNSGIISYVGNCYSHLPGGQQRIEVMELLGEHIKELEVYGSFPESQMYNRKGEINNKIVPDLYNQSYCVIAENNWHDIENYFTPRNLTAMAAGSCCLMKWFPGIERHFNTWEDCVIYRNKYDLLDIITYLRLNPGKRNEIANNAYKKAKEKYSLNNWVEQFTQAIS